MSITDELRAWSKEHLSRSSILAITDRIDENFRAACESEYAAGVMSVPIAVDESKWVKLPVDADGVPIHVGDVMECGDGTVFTVESISLYTFGWRCDGDGIDGNGYKCTAHPIPDCCRHHHAPNVEDLLREFGEKMHANMGRYVSNAWDMDEWCAADRDTIAEFAKRLQLREGK